MGIAASAIANQPTPAGYRWRCYSSRLRTRVQEMARQKAILVGAQSSEEDKERAIANLQQGIEPVSSISNIKLAIYATLVFFVWVGGKTGIAHAMTVLPSLYSICAAFDYDNALLDLESLTSLGHPSEAFTKLLATLNALDQTLECVSAFVFLFFSEDLPYLTVATWARLAWTTIFGHIYRAADLDDFAIICVVVGSFCNTLSFSSDFRHFLKATLCVVAASLPIAASRIFRIRQEQRSMEESGEQTRVYIFRPDDVSLADSGHLRVLVRFSDLGQDYNIDLVKERPQSSGSIGIAVPRCVPCTWDWSRTKPYYMPFYNYGIVGTCALARERVREEFDNLKAEVTGPEASASPQSNYSIIHRSCQEFAFSLVSRLCTPSTSLRAFTANLKSMAIIASTHLAITVIIVAVKFLYPCWESDPVFGPRIECILSSRM